MEQNKRPGRTRRSAAALLGLILLLPPLLAAQDKPLTLDEAVRLALERNEIAKSNQESVAAANARVQSARSFFFPSITSTSTYTRRAYEVRRVVGESEVVISRFNALSENLGLNMTLFDARSLSGLAAVRAQRNADISAAAENQRQLAFEVSQAFLETLGAGSLMPPRASRRPKPVTRPASSPSTTSPGPNSSSPRPRSASPRTRGRWRRRHSSSAISWTPPTPFGASSSCPSS
jgi:hypothetical protein